MMRPTQSTLQDFCRACLAEVKHRQKYNINTMDPKIQLWLEDCKLNNNTPSNVYSESVCKKCYDKFLEILKFQKLCIRSHQTVSSILQADFKKQQKEIEVPDRGNLLKNNLSADEQISVLNDIYGNQQWPDYNHDIGDCSRYQSPLHTVTTSNAQPTISSNLKSKSTQSLVNTQDSIRYIKEESKLKHLSTCDSQLIKTTYSKYRAQKTTTVTKNSNVLNKVNFKVIDGTNLDKIFTAKQTSNICQKCKISSSQQGTETPGNETEMKIYPALFQGDPLQICTKCGNKLENPQKMANSDLYKPKPNSPMRTMDHIANYKSRRSLTEHDLSRVSNSNTKYVCTQSTTANQRFVKKSCVASTRISGQLELPCSQDINDVRKPSFSKLKERRLQNILEKPYHCEKCGKRFIQLVALKTHLKTHNNMLIKMKSLSIIV